jgi:hypothetical protein
MKPQAVCSTSLTQSRRTVFRRQGLGKESSARRARQNQMFEMLIETCTSVTNLQCILQSYQTSVIVNSS